MSTLRYSLSIPEPHTHLVHVAVDVADLGGPYADVVMPAWSPGSYKVRDYAKHVQDLEAPGFRVEKIDKSRWRVHTRGKERLTLRYKVYAFEMSVRTSYVDADHAHLVGPSLFMYLDGAKDRPCALTIAPPRGWRVATGMEPAGPNRFSAPDYDTFIDCPLTMGDFALHRFRVLGKEHRFVIRGHGNYDARLLVRDTAKIVAEAARLMRGLPYKHYTFLLHATPEGGGGLEHLNSTSLQVRPFDFKPKERYLNVLRLISHEFFHLWNVKRTHPEPLGPFDYEREVYTTDLWIMEGLTSYYENLIVRRAGLMTADRYLKYLSEEIQKHRDTPGRKLQPMAMASFDSWIKFYQQDENSINTMISYYDKGELVGTILDLEIRRRTKNRRSLDDVMRALYERYGRHGRGYPHGTFQAIAGEIAGADLAPFFRAYVDGLKEIPFERGLAPAGLRLGREPRKKDEDAPPKMRAYIGITTRRQGERLFIASVLSGTAAYKAGLNARDEIIAVDDHRVDVDNWERHLDYRRPGDRVSFTVARMHALKTIPLTFGQRPSQPYKVTRVKKPQALHRKIYEAWLKAAWPKK